MSANNAKRMKDARQRRSSSVSRKKLDWLKRKDKPRSKSASGCRRSRRKLKSVLDRLRKSVYVSSGKKKKDSRENAKKKKKGSVKLMKRPANSRERTRHSRSWQQCKGLLSIRSRRDFRRKKKSARRQSKNDWPRRQG